MPYFGNQRPETFGWRRVPFVSFTYRGVTFPQGINPQPAVRVLATAMLDALVPHIPGGLRAGQCWGGDTEDRDPDSFHLYGIAFDLNAPENPQTGRPHQFTGPGVLPASTAGIIRPFGFEWGGSWTHATPPDYMHVQLMLSPQEASVWAGRLHPTTPAPPGSNGPWSAWSNLPPAHRTVALWDDGADVKSLQSVLNRWYPALAPLAIDGYYGSQTEGRVAYYQRRAGLTVDGITGRHTWTGLGWTVAY